MANLRDLESQLCWCWHRYLLRVWQECGSFDSADDFDRIQISEEMCADAEGRSKEWASAGLSIFLDHLISKLDDCDPLREPGSCHRSRRRLHKTSLRRRCIDRTAPVIRANVPRPVMCRVVPGKNRSKVERYRAASLRTLDRRDGRVGESRAALSRRQVLEMPHARVGFGRAALEAPARFTV